MLTIKRSRHAAGTHRTVHMSLRFEKHANMANDMLWLQLLMFYNL